VNGDASSPIAQARTLLASVRGRPLTRAERTAFAVEVATSLQEAIARDKRPRETQRDHLLAALADDGAGQAFTTCLTDRAYRSRDPARVVDAARGLLRALGPPRYLPPFARAQLGALERFGPFFPGLAARGLVARLARETASVILPVEDPGLARHLAGRRAEHTRVNVNLIGEAVLGEREAARRVERYTALLGRPDVEHISVKLSSIASRLDVAAFDATLARVRDRLATVYRAALASRTADGRAKTVSLDMEGRRELVLALAAFRAALDEPDLRGLGAGIALQAYLPEAPALQRDLTAWAMARVASGGAPVYVRLVKGANLLAERCEASLRGWPVPVHATKAAVDAAFLRMVEYGCRPEHARAVHLGIASHNVFSVAHALVTRAQHGVEDCVAFEMLEGMADPLRRAVCSLAADALVYAPVVDAGFMHAAIAYLVRRLDEGNAEENFLRSGLGLVVGSPAWDRERRRHEAASVAAESTDETTRSAERRRAPATRTTGSDAPNSSPASGSRATFVNEPDTDFALATNRAWMAEALARAHALRDVEVPLGIAGARIFRAPRADGYDPSRPGVVPYRHALATASDLERALATASEAARRWAATPGASRAGLLHAVADKLAERRADLVATMVLDAGKRVEEGDTEVSEAIDFARYYAETWLAVERSPEVALRPRGVALVTPPWNFPLAIPAGGALAALAAGNAVILKPALETALVGARLAECLWDAGVPTDALQLVLCEDDLASRLVADRRVTCAILTGATSTARRFLELRPELALFAETGGKNALVVSALADRELAVADALRSAFGHAGQKCSAASLLVLERELYDDPAFLATLSDAAASLPVGSAWDPESVVTPLIRPPEGPLLRALTTLEDGEHWLVRPRADPDNPRLWAPAIKLGVREGSFTHQTELFGPVLAVMRADDLDDAVRIANGTPYGLTAGLHSLDEREQVRWASRIEAGSLYVNRPITGAIVRRQPFGGWKASSFGPGAKAGGPDYVVQLAHVTDREPPGLATPPEPAVAALVTHVRPNLDERGRERLSLGACSYAHAWRTHFAVDHDPSAVLGERNVLRYLPCEPLVVRAGDGAEVADTLLACAAALTSHAAFTLSLDTDMAAARPFLTTLPGVTTRVEDAAACATALHACARVRAVGPVEPEVAAAARDAGIHVADEPVLVAGRYELRHCHREQALSVRWHRYGSLAAERLLPPLRGAT
jgi:RHH-type proline utilization regulon transcriptional repressor/proline dehydrogenase/delta 1-pyrroline-5-carboxylate dehydrogenase